MHPDSNQHRCQQQQQAAAAAASSSSSAKIPISLGEFIVNPVFVCAFCTDTCGGPHGLGYHAHWGSLTASPKGTADWTRNFDLPDQIFPIAFYRFWARRPAGFEPTTAAPIIQTFGGRLGQRSGNVAIAFYYYC